MTRFELTLFSISLAVWLGSCTDPGCIRNSECPTGSLCLNSVCVSPIDAGLEEPVERPTPNEEGGFD